MSSGEAGLGAASLEALRSWAAHDERRGLVELAPDGVITSWNAGAARIAGLTASQAIGRRWTDFSALPAENVQQAQTLRRGDGTTTLVRVHVSSRPQDESLGLALVLDEESELEGVEERYRASIDHAADALFTHLDGRVVDVNRAACESLGYTRDELIGMMPTQFDPDVTPAQVEDIVNRLGAGETVTFDSRHRRKDGSLFPVEVRVRSFLRGGHTYALSLARDISERKRVEAEFRASEVRNLATLAALRDSEERFELALRGANDGIWDWNLLTDEVVFSTRWKSMLGYAGDELDGNVSTWRRLLHPDDVARCEERVRQFLAHEIDKYEVEFRMAHKNGGYRTVLSRGYLVWGDGGRPVRFVGTHVDITERRQAESALRNSEEMLRRAQTIAHVASWSFEIGTDVFSCSEEGRRMMGWGSESTGAPPLSRVHPEDLPRVQAAWSAAREGKPYEIEHRVLTNDELRWVCVRATTDLDDRGGPMTIVGVSQDVTGRRKLEEQVQQSQRMDAIGQLAGGIAHDFNNLLTVINCSSEFALEELPPGPIRDEVIEIRGAGARAAELTNQLLAFSRKQILQARIVDVNALIARAERMLRRLIGEDVTIVTVLDPSLAKIRVDPGQLEQVIVNLVVNARDAMPTGGTLTIETRNVGAGQDRSNRPQEGPCVELSVTDTGVGIPEDLQAKIFEPFFTTKAPGKGTGLGLATVYGIVRQSGGHIGVTSRSGLGTNMTVFLPSVAPRPPSGSHRLDVTTKTYGGDETILLVEDDPVVRRTARTALERQGYTVVEADLGSTALQLAHEHTEEIHLLITDVVMPGMSGRQVADDLRTLIPGLTVLFMSGYTDDSIVRHGVLEAGVHFLAKPFTPISLVRAARRALDSDGS